LDKQPEPWTTLVKAMYLDEEMVVLAQRYPQHPLPKLLGPVFEKNETKLEKEARLVYDTLGGLPNHTPADCEQLQAIYTSLLFSRFKTKTFPEIAIMLTTLDITKTRAGRDLIAMGEKEGAARGKAATLIKLLSKRFGTLPAVMVEQIQHLNYLQLEQLDDQVLDVPDLAQLAKWLQQQKNAS
jgi:predicted transposase YdaD